MQFATGGWTSCTFKPLNLTGRATHCCHFLLQNIWCCRYTALRRGVVCRARVPADTNTDTHTHTYTYTRTCKHMLTHTKTRTQKHTNTDIDTHRQRQTDHIWRPSLFIAHYCILNSMSSSSSACIHSVTAGSRPLAISSNVSCFCTCPSWGACSKGWPAFAGKAISFVSCNESSNGRSSRNYAIARSDLRASSP